MPSRAARELLARVAESQFDPTMIAAFEAILASAGEDYRSRTRPDFRLWPPTSSEDQDCVAVAVSDSLDLSSPPSHPVSDTKLQARFVCRPIRHLIDRWNAPPFALQVPASSDIFRGFCIGLRRL